MSKKIRFKSNGIKVSQEADLLDKDTIKLIENYLYKHNMRDGCTFAFCNQTALRAGDLLSLKVQDLFIDGKVVDEFALWEEKTNKRRIISLNKKAKRVIQEYYDINKDEIIKKGNNYLFPSRTSKRDELGNKYYTGISVTSYDRLLRQAKHDLNLPDYLVVSSHCSRKAVGATLYNDCKVPIEQIQYMFNHASPQVTLRYIGIDKKKSSKLYYKFEI